MNQISPQDFLSDIKNSYHELCTLLNPIKEQDNEASYIRIKNFMSLLIAIEEDVYEMRLKKIVDEENPYLPAINVNKLREMKLYHTASLQRLVDRYLSLRLELLNFIQSLPFNVWDKTGVHELEGHVTFEEFIRRLVKNDRINIVQLRDNLMPSQSNN